MSIPPTLQKKTFLNTFKGMRNASTCAENNWWSVKKQEWQSTLGQMWLLMHDSRDGTYVTLQLLNELGKMVPDVYWGLGPTFVWSALQHHAGTICSNSKPTQQLIEPIQRRKARKTIMGKVSLMHTASHDPWTEAQPGNVDTLIKSK